ncbi:MAG: hypothetical protein WCI12_11230 [Actinomycetes bacterium]
MVLLLGTTTVVYAANPTTCLGITAADPLCQGISGIGSSIFGTGATAALDAMAAWVGNGAAWLLEQIGGALGSSTAVSLRAPWFVERYRAIESLLGIIALPLLLAAAIHALVRQSPGLLLRAALVQLPLGMVLAGAAVEFATMALAIVDELCRAVSGATPGSLTSLTTALAKALAEQNATNGPATPAFVVMLGAVLVAVAGLLLWVELVVRSAAIYVAVAFLPLTLIAMVWPSLASWSRRLAETLVALIASKLVVVVVLDMAVGALGTASGRGFSTVVTGLALLVLAAFAPFSLLKVLPMFEQSAAGHLEGLRQRSLASVVRGTPRRAIDMAMEKSRWTAPLEASVGVVAAGRGSSGSPSGPGRGGIPDGPHGDGRVGEARPADPMASSAAARAPRNEPPPEAPIRRSSSPQDPGPQVGGQGSETPQGSSGRGGTSETRGATPHVTPTGLTNDEPPLAPVIEWPKGEAASTGRAAGLEESPRRVNPSPVRSPTMKPLSLRIGHDHLGPRIEMVPDAPSPHALKGSAARSDES